MAKLVKVLTALGIVLVAWLTISHPTSAVTVELAKKCRALMVEAYPPKLAGSIQGNAKEERDYFRTCLARNGKMDNPPDSTVGRGKQPVGSPPAH
jgi:hypothetical protein